MATSDGQGVDQFNSNSDEVQQVMSGQVAANSAAAPLGVVVEGSSTTTSRTRDVSNVLVSTATSATGEGPPGMAHSGRSTVEVGAADGPLGMVSRPQALAASGRRRGEPA